MEQFDVIIIGAGPAGYVAALRCAQKGLNTACIDDWLDDDNKPSLGGTCLNVGCIPSKALLESSELYSHSQHELDKHGIQLKGINLDLQTMLARKDQVVKELTSGVDALFTANGISFISGRGKLLAERKVEVILHGTAEKKQIHANYVILAPGSVPRGYDAIPFDHKHVVDSTGALAFTKVPGKLAVIGAGVIALELGSVWRRLGAEVSLFKSSKGLLPAADRQISQQAEQIFRQQGLNFHFGSKIKHSKIKSGKVSLGYSDEAGDHQGEFDKVIIAVGRVPNTDDLVSDDSGIAFDESAYIKVDQQCQTNVECVFAIGDAVRGPMLAHKGSEEGIMVADLIAGEYARVNYETVPLVIYTDPEIAWCGQTEQQLQEKGIAFNAGVFPFASNGRARASGKTQGIVKILADKHTDRVLGVHMIGPHASELIAQAVIAMEFKSSSEDLAMTMFAHPALSEVVHEAALDVTNQALHKARAGKA